MMAKNTGRGSSNAGNSTQFRAAKEHGGDFNRRRRLARRAIWRYTLTVLVLLMIGVWALVELVPE